MIVFENLWLLLNLLILVVLLLCTVSAFDLIVVPLFAGIDGYMHASPGRVGGDETSPEVRKLGLLGRGKYPPTF